MTTDYSTLNKQQLEDKLRKLQDEYEDLEDTFSFNLTNTSAHLSSGAVAEHEEELEELKKEIAHIKGLLGKG